MVVIKDFEMPTCCFNCRLLNLDCSCSITHTDGQEICFNRNDDCPLVEVEDGNE